MSIRKDLVEEYTKNGDEEIFYGKGPQAIVLLSGGLDSTTALALACKRYGNRRVATLSISYGQRHQVELQCAQTIADYFGVQHQEMTLPVPSGDSVLMAPGAEMPHNTYSELQAQVGPSPTYVPFRNGIMLSTAAAHALTLEANEIYVGVHAEDAHNWAYPDCTPEFIGAMQNAIYIGTYMKVRLVAPFTYKTKAEIIQLGIDLHTPYQFTHSCYEGKRPACGQCPTCVSRLEAFRSLGYRDPIEYQFDNYREGSNIAGS